jgi:O-antigen ligase
MQETDFTRRRNIWFVLTLAAFLSHNFWLYTLIAIPVLIYANRLETNSVTLYFFVLFALPVDGIAIPGMGVINYVFTISHTRILALVILFPAFLALRRQNDYIGFGRLGTDKLLLAYLLLTLALSLGGTTATDGFRQVFYLLIDVILPYLVISRSLKNMQAFRESLLGLVLAIMLLALIGVFEISRHWLLYADMAGALDLTEGAEGEVLGRDGMIRSVATTGQPIVLGLLIAVGIGLYLYLQPLIQQKFNRRLGMALLAAGSFSTLSRGPWVGVAVLLFVYIATGRNALRHLILMLLVASISLPVISILPGGERIINLLPFVGTKDQGNVQYREKLLNNSMIVIQRNPWFGSADYMKTPEMQEMRQGQGIIDIVNSYIQITLRYGLVGLGLFAGFFALTMLDILRAMRLIKDKGSEEHLLGRALLATLVSILVIITTVSSISFIPLMCWSVAGLGVAYAQMVRRRAAGGEFSGKLK